MLHGLMIVNAFLKTNKFDDIYTTLLNAAAQCGMALEVKTNAELCAAFVNGAFAKERYDYVLFWDKDVQLAMQLEQLGLRLFNCADSILRCDDKALTYLSLQGSGIAMPTTIIAPKTFPNIGYSSLDFLVQVEEALGYPMVVKECFGSFGQQVYMVRDRQELTQKVQSLAGTPMLFQQPIKESLGRDIRLNVVGDRVVAGMLRRSTDGDFRSNLSRGGAMARYTPTEQEIALAVQAAKHLGLDFCGVDVLFGKEGPILCEVNSNAHFRTTLQCTGVNMAVEIMHHISAEMGKALC